MTETQSSAFRILSLDGGGAKGVYTLGVLKEIEALTSKPLCESFDLIFGTSTGSIIASLLALGYRVDDVYSLYKTHVPTIMKGADATERSAALRVLAQTVFQEKTFLDVKTGVGVVATRWAHEKPMIFKGSVSQAHGRQATFAPGFGCKIADAVQASCSAFPFFSRHTVVTSNGESVELIDGGYCANNPTLYAIADAAVALNIPRSNIRVLSIGVGVYPEPNSWTSWRNWKSWFFKQLLSVQLLQKTLSINTESMEQLRSILFKDIQTVRINDTFVQPELATDLMEHDLNKLDLLFQRGRESYGKYEPSLKLLLGV